MPVEKLSILTTPTVANSPRRETIYSANVLNEDVFAGLEKSSDNSKPETEPVQKKKKGGCKAALNAGACKTCIAPMKKTVRMCAAPMKNCVKPCKTGKKDLVPTPRLGNEWKAYGAAKRVAFISAETLKMLWFMFSLYVLFQLVVAFSTASDYDPESFYPIRLGLRLWDRTIDNTSGLNWLC